MLSRTQFTWCALLLVAFAGCGSRPSTTLGHDPAAGRSTRLGRSGANVRVGLAVQKPSVRFSANGGFRSEGGGRSLSLAPGEIVARHQGDRIVLETRDGRFEFDAPELRLIGSGGAPWGYDRDRFGGELILRRNDDGSISLINEIAIEDYLRGVVPWEIGRPDDDALEAVKAQAIAARTYTYARLGRWSALGFDLYADVRDQVYRGRSGTAEICDRAVEQTEYTVAARGGELIRAYYYSTSGGHTSTLTDVWTRDGAPYLIGRRDADPNGRSWSADSPHFRWTEVWSAKELGEVVRAELPTELKRRLKPREIGILTGLEVLERDESGRVKRLAIHTDRDRFELWGDRIRWVLRPLESRFGILRSTMFQVENVRRDGALVAVVLRGGGFGHGVGMCQTGALARARAGQDAREILRAYYDEIDVVDVRSLRRRGLAR